jgi:hypothetical protein
MINHGYISTFPEMLINLLFNAVLGGLCTCVCALLRACVLLISLRAAMILRVCLTASQLHHFKSVPYSVSTASSVLEQILGNGTILSTLSNTFKNKREKHGNIVIWVPWVTWTFFF